MPACERCWSEYQRRLHGGEHQLTYSEVVVERDRNGGCTPEEQCGEMHLLCVENDTVCRCGKNRRVPYLPPDDLETLRMIADGNAKAYKSGNPWAIDHAVIRDKLRAIIAKCEGKP